LKSRKKPLSPWGPLSQFLKLRCPLLEKSKKTFVSLGTTIAIFEIASWDVLSHFLFVTLWRHLVTNRTEHEMPEAWLLAPLPTKSRITFVSLGPTIAIFEIVCFYSLVRIGQSASIIGYN
jgi:hypothetical protein